MAHESELDFSKLKQSKAFAEWFWKSKDNGNELIKFLNKNRPSGDSDRLRREKLIPCIYGVVVNYPIQESPDMKLVKIGLTRKVTTTGERNRMETVEKDIISNLKQNETIMHSLSVQSKDKEKVPVPLAVEKLVSVLFVAPIDAVDISDFNDIENLVREKVGIKVPSDTVKNLGLPVPTEWVVAKQVDLTHMRKKIAENREDGSMFTTAFFEDDSNLKASTKNDPNTISDKSIPETWPLIDIVKWFHLESSTPDSSSSVADGVVSSSATSATGTDAVSGGDKSHHSTHSAASGLDSHGSTHAVATTAVENVGDSNSMTSAKGRRKDKKPASQQSSQSTSVAASTSPTPENVGDSNCMTSAKGKRKDKKPASQQSS